MPSNVLQIFGAGISLLAGFLFLHFSLYRRYSAERLRTDRYALHVVGCALIFFPIGLLLDYYYTSELPLQREIAYLQNHGLPFAVAYACAVALIAAVVDNVITLIAMSDELYPLDKRHLRLWDITKLAAVARYVQNSHDPALRILYRATMLRKRLMVTMKSGKVYVGEPPSRIDPSATITSIHLIPFASGYRHKETRKVELTTEYSSLAERLTLETPTLATGSTPRIYDPLRQDFALLKIDATRSERIDLEDLGIVLVWAEIDSMTIFDSSIYKAFKQGDKLAEGSISELDGSGRLIDANLDC
jgi:hypothetical protein